MTNPDFHIKNFTWADEPGGPKEHGIRIGRARGWVFIPNSEVLDLANALADHIERSRA